MSHASGDRAWKEYSARFREKVLPSLLGSQAFLSIGAEGRELDVRQATELGTALILGKPFLLLIPRGRTVPPGLRRAADVVVDDWDPRDPRSQEKIAIALERLGVGGAS